MTLRRLWTTILIWLAHKFTVKPAAPMLPGTCECKHPRCLHKRGRFACNGWHPPTVLDDQWRRCACLHFIRSDDPGEPDTPSPADLERLLHL